MNNTKLSKTAFYTLIITLLLCMLRIFANTNPLYSLTEPAVTQLNRLSSLTTPANTSDDSLIDINTALVDSVVAENEELRSMLGLVKNNSNLVNAEVTRKDVLSFNKLIWIDRGVSSGISKGDAVVSNDQLVGVVATVYENTSAVTLVTDPNFSTTIKTTDKHHGVLKNVHGSLIVDLLPNKQLSGSAIFTDGLDEKVQNDLFIGVMQEEISGNSSIFGTYSVLMSINPADIKFVSVVGGG